MSVWMLHRPAVHMPNLSTAGQKHVSYQVTAHYEAVFHSVRAVKDKSVRTSRMSCQGLWLLFLMESMSWIAWKQLLCSCSHQMCDDPRWRWHRCLFNTRKPGLALTITPKCLFGLQSTQPTWLARVLFSVCCSGTLMKKSWSCTDTQFPRLLQETTGRSWKMGWQHFPNR